jgi:hypothetical protein
MTYDLEDLVESLEGGRAIAFLGSGVSAGAGLPDWPGLLRELIEIGFRREILNQAERDELVAWAAKPDYLMEADAILRKFGRGEFQDFMARKFNTATAGPTELHRTLASMPFAAFVTTNFDRLLEDAWSAVRHSALEVLTHKDRGALRNPFGRGTAFLLKTHGCASKPDTLVLGLEEFRESIHDNRPCQTLMQSIFLRYQVLFIGHSLSDPDLLFLLDQLVGTFGVPSGRHFALIKDEDVGRLRAATFRHNFGIEVLRYTASPGHPEVLRFVQHLQVQAQQRRADLRKDVRRQLREDLAEAAADLSPPTVKPAMDVAAPHPRRGQYSEATLSDYCRRHLDESTWHRLREWYESLAGTPERDLLHLNLDRECQGEDLDPEVWQEFLRRLAAHGPLRADPFAALWTVIDEDPGLFVLQGRKIEGSMALRRYMRYEDFEALLVGPPSAAMAHESGDDSRLENKLLGRPGHPVWCTDATYAAETNPQAIARDIWPYQADHVVEIAYASETLMPDNYIRVATVPDIYSSSRSYVNVKKSEAGASGWCHTVRLDDPTLRDRAPSAIHAPLRLLAARTRKIGLRIIGSAARSAKVARS